MISYALNCLNDILERVFAGVEHGFYIDVGASDPVHDSVTLHLYERGWRGVNVEPDPLEFERLAAARERDVNLEAAVGSGKEPVAYYPSAVRGHGTLDEALADSRGETATLRIPQIALSRIFEDYAPSEGVDFLKIDVEGWEADVLASADWERDRPRVVVVEAVDIAGRPTHERWEPTLLDHRYSMALFDGVNRFYCRVEDHDRISDILAAPANVLDDWTPVAEATLQEQLRDLAPIAARQAETEGELDRERMAHARTRRELEEALGALVAEREVLERAEAELATIYDSISWRLVSPVHDVSRLARLMRRDRVA
jgi:FkbM family methyltransferase